MQFVIRQFRDTGRFFRKRLLWIFLICLASFLLIAAASCFLFLSVPQILDPMQKMLLEAFQSQGVLDENGISCWKLLLNNLRAGAVTALLGFIPFLFLPAFSLIVNALMIGLAGAIIMNVGASPVLFLAGILPHGIFEIPALMLSMACGIRICLTLVKKIVGVAQEGECKEAFLGALRVFLLMAIPLFIIAAPIEVYITPAVMGWFL